MLTFQDQKMERNVLHKAALNGDNHFCTMIVLESHKMGVHDQILNQTDRDGLTPLYLLCERGFKKENEASDDEFESDKEEEEPAATIDVGLKEEHERKYSHARNYGPDIDLYKKVEYNRHAMDELVDRECK